MLLAFFLSPLPRPRPKSERAAELPADLGRRESRCDVWGLILYKHVAVDVPSLEGEHESIVKCQQIESCQNIVQGEQSGDGKGGGLAWRRRLRSSKCFRWAR